MFLDPKIAYKTPQPLSAAESSHNTYLTIMNIHPPNFYIVIKDEDNFKVFKDRFEYVYRNLLPTDHKVIQQIQECAIIVESEVKPT